MGGLQSLVERSVGVCVGTVVSSVAPLILLVCLRALYLDTFLISLHSFWIMHWKHTKNTALLLGFFFFIFLAVTFKFVCHKMGKPKCWGQTAVMHRWNQSTDMQHVNFLHLNEQKAEVLFGPLSYLATNLVERLDNVQNKLIQTTGQGQTCFFHGISFRFESMLSLLHYTLCWSQSFITQLPLVQVTVTHLWTVWYQKTRAHRYIFSITTLAPSWFFFFLTVFMVSPHRHSI